MSWVLQVVLGIVAVLIGLVLGAVVALVWLPCAGAPMPLDALSAPQCAAVAEAGSTAWMGLLLWPIALAFAGFAAVRAIARGSGMRATITVAGLAVVTIMANPLLEYWLLNLRARSLQDPPGTGALTAATFLLAGVVLLTTLEERSRVATRRAAAAW